jgi:hypothetical protein
MVLVLGGLATWGFLSGRNETTGGDEDESEEQIAPASRVSIVNGESIVTLDPAAQRQNGIETAALANTVQSEQVRAYGLVLELQSLDDLANSYVNAKAQEQIAQAKLAASQAAYARARELYADQQNISAAQLQAAEAAFRIDRAGLAAAHSLTQTLAVSAQQLWGPSLSSALIEGTSLLTRLITHQLVLLQVTLRPEQRVAQPPTGAYVQLPDGTHVPLAFVSAATRTDPRIQGPSLFFTAPAAASLLPGMGVAVFLPAARAVTGILVPPDAIVWAQGQPWAYFRTGPNSFARRPMSAALAASAGGYVVLGQPEHVQVVIRGAQMLLSEQFRAQVQMAD